MIRTKICGITNSEDALTAVRLGADILGFNFYEKSPRHITPETAGSIIRELPSNVSFVGVFVNEEIESIQTIAETAGLDAIQLHGDEDPAFVGSVRDQTGLEVIKAFRVGKGFDVESVLNSGADAILLDSYSAKGLGGTGKTFDWALAHEIQSTAAVFTYLAGGLSPENVAEAIRKARPQGLDVCSGVESSPGKKDPVKVAAFIKAAMEAI